jgi:hypothetical protein
VQHTIAYVFTNMQQGCENGPRSPKLVTPHKVLLVACEMCAAHDRVRLYKYAAGV